MFQVLEQFPSLVKLKEGEVYTMRYIISQGYISSWVLLSSSLASQGHVRGHVCTVRGELHVG
jgi:hypothetical protein